MNAGAHLIYAQDKRDRPALYVAPYGLLHILEVRFKGKPQLVYVPARAIRLSDTSTGEPHA